MQATAVLSLLVFYPLLTSQRLVVAARTPPPLETFHFLLAATTRRQKRLRTPIDNLEAVSGMLCRRPDNIHAGVVVTPLGPHLLLSRLILAPWLAVMSVVVSCHFNCGLLPACVVLHHQGMTTLQLSAACRCCLKCWTSLLISLR